MADGNTIIGRSAIGLRKEARVLDVAVGDTTSAGSIAKLMHHAGALGVAQLNVNWSFPKFLVYSPENATDLREMKQFSRGFGFPIGTTLTKLLPETFSM